MRNLRFPIIALVFILALGLALGGSGLWHHRAVAVPLQAATEALAGVEAVRVGRSGTFTDLEVELDPTARLIAVYPELRQAVERFTRPESAHIVLHDRRNEVLTNAYYAVRLVIEEGIATGRFAAMAHGAEATLSELGVEHSEVFVDTAFVYVQLYDGAHYLFDVIPRYDNGAHTL